jgi:hypothetical protein
MTHDSKFVLQGEYTTEYVVHELSTFIFWSYFDEGNFTANVRDIYNLG